MTSSSNIAGDLKQGSRFRKMNARYFSLKWKTDSGESAVEKNSAKYKSNEAPASDSNGENNSSGFFKSIKKKLSIKNLYKSKRKIITTESSVGLDEGSSSLTTDSNDISHSHNPEKNQVDIKDRLSVQYSDVSTVEIPNDQTQCSRNQTIESSSSNSLNIPTNTSNDRASSENGEDFTSSIDMRDNENDIDHGVIRPISETEHYVNNEEEIANPLVERLNSELVQEIVCNPQLDNQDKTSDIESPNLITSKESQCSLSQELVKLSKYGWYWGSISGDEADAKLFSEPDGAFLIRDSSDHRYLLTLSFKSAGKLLHARVEHHGGLFSLCNHGESGRFSSVVTLINHSMNFSRSAIFCYSRPRYPGYPAFPVRLTKPVSRFSQVRSLQYLCRFVIRQRMRRDNICKLPLPESIKEYVQEGPYY